MTHDTGPLLIVAGAGTGKTSVITRRIAWLIAQRKARPEEILAMTFTDKAAAEMEERVDTLVPYGYADVEISTFHAFGDRILREHALEIGLTPDFRVLNRAEQVIFLRDRLFELPLSHYRPLGDPTRHLQALITLISRCKDEDVSPQEYQAHAERLAREAASAPDYEESRERAAQQRELAAAYAKYQELMAGEGCVDFGDQIVLVLRLFRSRPYVLGAYQRRYRYILVDEFQDTNHAQFDVVKLLAARHGNVAVVADDDQAIYRWRAPPSRTCWASWTAIPRRARWCSPRATARIRASWTRPTGSSSTTIPTGWRCGAASASAWSPSASRPGRRPTTGTTRRARRRPTPWPS